MRYANLLFALALEVTAADTAKRLVEPYPKVSYASAAPYKKNDMIPLDCSKRQIETGEHFFDEKGNIIYQHLPKCKETGEPPSLLYGKDQQMKCTITMEDKVYHLFQLYIHKDAPLTCRLETKPDTGAYIPLDLTFRGDVLESHIDLDPNLTVLLYTDKDGTIVTGASFCSSSNTTKVVIGDEVTLQFDVRWNVLRRTLAANTEPFYYYQLPTNNGSWPYVLLALASALVGAIASTVYNSRRTKRLQLSKIE